MNHLYDHKDRNADDLQHGTEVRMAKRVLAALMHPDNPVPMFQMDASKLARFISIRINRMKGPKE